MHVIDTQGDRILNLVARDLGPDPLHQLHHEVEVVERRERIGCELIRLE